MSCDCHDLSKIIESCLAMTSVCPLGTHGYIPHLCLCVLMKLSLNKVQCVYCQSIPALHNTNCPTHGLAVVLLCLFLKFRWDLKKNFKRKIIKICSARTFAGCLLSHHLSVVVVRKLENRSDIFFQLSFPCNLARYSSDILKLC